MPCRLRDRVAAAVLLSIFPLAQVSSLSAQATGVTSNPRPPGVTPIRAAPRAATIDDLLAIKAVSDVAISPDGRWIAYVVTTRDAESNLNKSDIWLVGADDARPRQITRGPRTDRAPQWAPDGSWLAFLSDRGEKRHAQVYGIEPNGGEAWPVTKGETTVTTFRISPDGRRIAYVAPPTVAKADQELEKVRGRPIVRDSAYASQWARVWVADLHDRAARAADSTRPSSPDLLDVTSVAWAPDSRQLAWSAKPSPTLRSNAEGAVYVQREAGAAPVKVTTMAGGESVAAWVPDLGLIIAGTAQTLGTYNRKLWLVPPTGGEPVPLTAALDEDASFVAATSRALYVEASQRTGRGLFRIRLDGARPAGAVERLSDDTRFYSGFSATKDGSRFAFLVETATTPPDVHVTDVSRFAPARLTTINPGVADLAFGAQRVVRWKSAADDEAIEGVLTLPVGYRDGARVPLLLVIHGGPSGVSSNRFPPTRGAYPIPVFNGLGYAVLQPNYRGSTGYGERFRGLNRGDISGRDWVDVSSGVDAMVSAGIADSSKLGVMGWSFGGHHTFWGITQTTRFKAASAGAGANDLISMYSQTDMPEFYHTYLGPRPWEDFELYESRSAYRNVAKVTTPLLIQVGEADRRVPAEQSIQFYEAMKGIGKAPVTLVLYPGQPHGITDPRLSRDLMQRNVDWFTRWIPVDGGRMTQDR
jgi:dipeptidyl aminopeptidase/acylaminoacyl peptidase